MSDEARQRLLAATRHAAEAARGAVPAGEPAGGRRGGRRGGRKDGGADEPPVPGDLYALAATAGHAVEWLVAARHEAQPRHLLLVPADSDPWVGSADLEVPAQDGGPLVLHCHHARWIDAAALAGGHRGGRLEASWGAAAAERWRAVEAGTHRGSPVERETDDDPEYRDRNRELAAAAAALAALSAAAEHARQASRFRNPLASVPLLRAVAAMLLAALLGVGWWAMELRRQVIDLRPHNLLSQVVAEGLPMGGQERGEVKIVLNGEGSPPVVLVYGEEQLKTGSYVLQLVAAGGRILWSEGLTLGPGDEWALWLREPLPAGDYLLRLVDPATSPPQLVDEETLHVSAP